MRFQRLYPFILLASSVILAACAAEPTEAPEVEAPEVEAPEASGEPIKIGFVGDLSGDWALTNQPYLDGAKYAVDEINAAGGVLG